MDCTCTVCRKRFPVRVTSLHYQTCELMNQASTFAGKTKLEQECFDKFMGLVQEIFLYYTIWWERDYFPMFGNRDNGDEGDEKPKQGPVTEYFFHFLINSDVHPGLSVFFHIRKESRLRRIGF